MPPDKAPGKIDWDNVPDASQAPDTGVGPDTPAAPTASKYAKPGSYTTKLPRPDEAKFQQWVKTNNVPWQDSPTADYDMRGYWKAQQGGDPNAKQAGNLHFPDTYKTPYHKTFSNESKYALPN